MQWTCRCWAFMLHFFGSVAAGALTNLRSTRRRSTTCAALDKERKKTACSAGTRQMRRFVSSAASVKAQRQHGEVAIRPRLLSSPMVGTVAVVAGGPTRRRPKRDPQTESLVTPYVINQTLVRGWIWAFQVKSFQMVQESALSNEVLLFSLKQVLAFGLRGDVRVVGMGSVNGTKHLPVS